MWVGVLHYSSEVPQHAPPPLRTERSSHRWKTGPSPQRQLNAAGPLPFALELAIAEPVEVRPPGWADCGEPASGGAQSW